MTALQDTYDEFDSRTHRHMHENASALRHVIRAREAGQSLLEYAQAEHDRKQRDRRTVAVAPRTGAKKVEQAKAMPTIATSMTPSTTGGVVLAPVVTVKKTQVVDHQSSLSSKKMATGLRSPAGKERTPKSKERGGVKDAKWHSTTESVGWRGGGKR